MDQIGQCSEQAVVNNRVADESVHPRQLALVERQELMVWMFPHG